MIDARIIDSPENAEKYGMKSVSRRLFTLHVWIAGWDITSIYGHKQLRLLIFL